MKTIAFCFLLFLPIPVFADEVTLPSSSTTCGPLMRERIFHLSRIESGVRYYYLYAEFNNLSTDVSWGAKVKFLKAHENPGLTYGESLPILVNKGEAVKGFVFARSTQRFGNVTTNNTTNITNNPYFRDNSVFVYCAPLGSSDLLFTATRDRKYSLQRSKDQVNWETFEVIRPPSFPEITELTIWRPKAVMQSVPGNLIEHYRVIPECFNETDCQTENARLTASQIELGATYR